MSKKKTALLLLCCTVVLTGAYFALVGIGAWFITPIYLGLATVIGLVFICYNRGFYAAKAKPEELPSNMTQEQKLAFIREGKERLDRSRWVIAILFSLIFALACDMIYLYILPYFQEMLS